MAIAQDSCTIIAAATGKKGPGVNSCGIRGREMYTLLECLALAGLVLVLGAALFLAVSLFVLVEAGVRAVATRSRPLASRNTTEVGEKLEASPWPRRSAMAIKCGLDGHGVTGQQNIPEVEDSRRTSCGS